MSRLQGHRKSQSTSALNVIADGGFSMLPGRGVEGERRREKRASRHPALGRVEEGSDVSSRMGGMPVPPLPTSRSRRDVRDSEGEKVRREKSRGREMSEEEIRSWMTDVSSLRSSDRRRNAALRGLEKAVVRCCVQSRNGSESGMSIATLINLQLHRPLLTVLTRHAQSLASRYPPKDDELALMIIELSSVVGLLQGLCLLSRRCKEAVGEQHIFEILIDLLLLLRTQPPPPSTSASSTTPEPRSIVYTLLELLCCVLVDSPENARTFERLSGLEAVVRVLKGTGVAKEIRMKCLEFLYFYLQPEEANKQARTVSSSSAGSASSSSSGESLLYPPSPLSSSIGSVASGGRTSPSPLPTRPSKRFEDLDMPFIPQTPQKKPQPSLGYLTPSTRRASGGSAIASTTPTLEPVPASPHDEQPTLAAPTPSGKDRVKEDRDARRWSIMEAPRSANRGLGLGLPKSSSMSTNLSLASAPTTPSNSSRAQRDVTAIKVTDQVVPSNTFFDPFSDTTRSSSSGSSTVVPTRKPTSTGLTGSSTASELSGMSSDTSSSRRVSLRRPSRLSQPPTTALTIPEVPAPRAQKTRHSRTQSHLSSIPLPPLSTKPVPSLPESLQSRRRSTPPSALPTIPVPSTPSRSSSSMLPPPQPTPARRAFPAELTKGIPPSISSPALSTPLGPTRRVPSSSASSDKRAMGDISKRSQQGGGEREKKDVRSYEEKKELLSTWLGNVDALVQGVEKVSFWGYSSNEGKREQR